MFVCADQRWSAMFRIFLRNSGGESRLSVGTRVLAAAQQSNAVVVSTAANVTPRAAGCNHVQVR